MLTGMGASYVEGDVYGLPTTKVTEFDALGTGGLYLTGLEETVVGSIGTGTVFVYAGPEGIWHIGGSAVGGGTLVGLSSRLFGIRDVEVIADMAEAFRSGLETVAAIQTESALSLGMNRLQVMRYVVLPQAFSISVPAFMANVIFLLKETSVFSAVSLMDLMFTAKDLIGLYYKTTESLFLLVVFYLLILLPISILGSLLERRLRYAGFGD